jgi:hypothetical protein
MGSLGEQRRARRRPGLRLTVTCQGRRAVLRIAPIAADLRSGSVRVKGGELARSRSDAEGALDAGRAGPHLP